MGSPHDEQLWQRTWSLPTPELRALLEAGADPNYRPHGSYETTFLRVVGAVDHEGLALLLKANADVLVVDHVYQRSALHRLMISSQHDVALKALLLLEAGAEANRRDLDGRTPLHHALLHAPLSALRALLEHGALVSTHELLALAVPDPERVALLLAHSAPINPEPGAAYSALHRAALHPQVSSLRLLLAAGAQVDLPFGERGESALRCAVSWGAHEIARALLDAGADPRGPDHLGRSPLDVAIHTASLSMLQLLLASASEAKERAAIQAQLIMRRTRIEQREAALLDVLGMGMARFYAITPGFKYECDDEQLIFCDDARWCFELRDGYSGSVVVHVIDRQEALKKMLQFVAARESSPEELLDRIERRFQAR